FKYIQTRDIRSTFYLLFAIFFGILLCAPQLFPTIELYTQSFRSTIFQKAEVVPWAYLPTLFAPDFFGNPVTRNAWLGSYAEWNGYIGLAGLCLCLYALKNIKKGVILFFFLGVLVGLLFAYDSPLLSLLTSFKIPVLSTSALSRVIVLFSFSAAILAGFGLDVLIEDIKHRKFRGIVVLLCFTGFIMVGLWAASILKIFLSPEHALIARSNLKFPTLIFIALYVVFGIGVFVKSKKTPMMVAILLVLLVTLDLFRFSTKWMPFDPKNLVYPDAPITRFYTKISGVSRVFGNFGGEDAVYYHLPSVEGYDAIYVRRYGQFLASLDRGTLKDSYRSVVSYPKMGKYALSGANFLGVKYIVHKITDGQNVWEFPFWKYDLKTIKLIFDDHKYQVLENTNAFPRAFLVNTVVERTDPQEILDTMFNPGFNLRNSAVVEENINLGSYLGTGSAEITKYLPNTVQIRTHSDKESFLVLTDAFYPGWTAQVDGKPAPIYRTDFAFRGVAVPKGAHRIDFDYAPASFRYGIYVAIIGLVGMAVLAIAKTKK
ncbi:MAG: YfhO family protein, partial [Candidatus Levyibacteriota bacterium]